MVSRSVQTPTALLKTQETFLLLGQTLGWRTVVSAWLFQSDVSYRSIVQLQNLAPFCIKNTIFNNMKVTSLIPFPTMLRYCGWKRTVFIHSCLIYCILNVWCNTLTYLNTWSVDYLVAENEYKQECHSPFEELHTWQRILL